MIVKKRVCDECFTELEHARVTVRCTVNPAEGKKTIIPFDYCIDHGKEVLLKLKFQKDERVKSQKNKK